MRKAYIQIESTHKRRAFIQTNSYNLLEMSNDSNGWSVYENQTQPDASCVVVVVVVVVVVIDIIIVVVVITDIVVVVVVVVAVAVFVVVILITGIFYKI